MKRLVYLLSLGVFLSACGEGSIRSIDSDLFFSQENPFQPVITIQGENPITIERTTAWNEPGVFAQSYREGNISNRIQVSSNVNFNKIGSYQIVYSVSDSQGRTSSATRQVIVNDTILPTVTINDADLGESPSFNKNTARSIFISDSSGDAIKYQAVVVSANNCSSADFANAPQKNISEPFILNPNVGANKVCVRGIDEAGNIQATPTDSMILEIQNPSLSITLNPTSPTNEFSVTVTAEGQGIDFFKVIRRQGEQTCDGLTESDFSDAAEFLVSANPIFSGLEEGDHQFCAIGRNAEGDYDLTQVAEATLEVDRTPPAVSVAGPFLSGIALNRPIRSVDPVTYTVTYSGHSEITLSEGHVQLNSENGDATCSVDPVTGSDNQRTVTLSNCTGNGTVGITIALNSARDAAGNQAPASAASTTFMVDNEAPTISLSSPSSAATNSSTPVTYTVTYTDASTISLSANDITLNPTGATSEDQPSCSVISVDSVTGSDNQRTVTLSNCTGNGTVGITIAPDSARDAAGNQAASVTSDTFTVDNTAPTITILGEVRNEDFTHNLLLCEDAEFSPTASDSSSVTTTFPDNFDFLKTGITPYVFTATDAAGNIRTVTMTLDIRLPTAYSHDGIFHRVQNGSDLTEDRNLFLCEDLTFGDNSQFTSITEYNSIFEGNQKVISDLDTSLFGNLGGSSQVRNLVLKNLAAELTSENTGGLASLNQGLIEQVGIRGANLSISCDADCEDSFFGGLVGVNHGTIKNSYFEGEIQNPTEQTAGLVGRNLVSIERSYSSTNLHTRALSLVVESDSDQVIKSYWNCGEDSCSNDEGESAGTALSLSEMENPSSFVGFDFGEVWKMFGSDSEYRYPVLKFEE